MTSGKRGKHRGKTEFGSASVGWRRNVRKFHTWRHSSRETSNGSLRVDFMVDVEKEEVERKRGVVERPRGM